MKYSFYLILINLSCILLLSSCKQSAVPVDIIPSPKQVSSTEKITDFSKGYNLALSNISENSIADIVKKDLNLLSAGRIIENAQGASLLLKINELLEKEEYTLTSQDGVQIIGGSYEAIILGLSSLYQLIDEENHVPNVKIEDKPDFGFRSLMLDCARNWHDLDNLKSIIRLCQFYKLNYLHLHLTDDQLFTFPSAAFPKLMTEQHYSKSDLQNLNEYAKRRGIILIPEVDMPGHASQFINKMPEVFGIDDINQNRYTISLGSEKAYEAIDVLISEMAEIFTYSPYIHIGGDEAFFENMEKDPTTISYMENHNIPSIEELFRHFINRVNKMVKSHNKQMMIWAGFKPKGKIEVSKDIIIMLWESVYYPPKQLQNDGYSFINASFKPLYVVNNRKWDPTYILTEWNPRRWESWAADIDTFSGVELASNKGLLGATMCTWEQGQINEIPRLKRRLPAMVQNLWNEGGRKENAVLLGYQDINLSNFIRPFYITADGLKNTELEEGNYYDHLEFDGQLSVNLHAVREDLKIHFNTENRTVGLEDPLFPSTFSIDKNTKLDLQAFDKNGRPIGHPLKTRYIYKPITAIKKGLENELPPNSWKKMRYQKSLEITLESKIDSLPIKYSLDGSSITSDSETYKEPIKLDEGETIVHLRAQHFDSNQNRTVGASLSERYYEIIPMPSLTTGKKSWASNSHSRPNVTEYVNDGRITLWEQWGDHLDGNNWIIVDLEKEEMVKELLVVNFWDNYRYYQYFISGSQDGENWTELVDFRENTELSTEKGYRHKIDPTKLRYLKINLTYNSANPGLHLIEFGAW